MCFTPSFLCGNHYRVQLWKPSEMCGISVWKTLNSNVLGRRSQSSLRTLFELSTAFFVPLRATI